MSPSPRTLLSVHEHTLIDGAVVFEVWYDNEFIATITGTPGRPGVRVISKHHLIAGYVTTPGPHVVEVRVVLDEDDPYVRNHRPVGVT